MKYKVAALQLNTTESKEHNLNKISHLIKTAAENGAKLISLPEVMNVISDIDANVSEAIPGETTDLLIALSEQYNVWIHGGSIITEHSKPLVNPYNTTVMISPKDGIVTKYRKLHLFDVDIEDGVKSQESNYISKGEKIVVIDTDIGCLGFSICYDIRFPELYRTMALLGAQVIFVPANFTYKTGTLHWESLLRCRAIENNCYVIASAQCGINVQFRAYGHSMIIDPNGRILSQLGDEEGIAYATVDLSSIEVIRKQIPSLKNRRADVYGCGN